ncbi:hypothetical protein [Candidatus Lucifugimonas marina]|uniref:DUF1080 domain-containing protein n=1 Tax=Candidatus Lucifugimonas marina TaxID=3038979 RepID=A0AAJ5ZES2_9CHLR|nr:hypothetical protein [SAR202 cluster bacterium JH702]MDG0870922.1 hypothetical protein [SAR202 cluster bacterium JH639]WFG34849.1 hypothetical protein GKN94_03830 [SAR202 cluster bacterium JH545]WFG38789.1 hypothetical protein GKO48_03910 [SAR202 cluster bacterium JH1073]
MRARPVAIASIVVFALTLSIGIVTASENQAKLPDGPVVVNDDFTDTAGTTLTSHSPNIDDVGGGWKVEFGPNFEIAPSGREVRNTFGLDSPYYAVIDGKLEDNDVTVDFTRTGQTSEVGIVFRWQDSSNHYRGVFDGTNGYLIKTIAGVEFLLDSGGSKWKAGDSSSIRVVASAGNIKLYRDNFEIATATDTELRDKTHIGLYYRNETTSSIGNFTVRALGDPASAPTPVFGSLVLEDNFDAGAGGLNSRPANNVGGANEWVDIIGTWEATAGGQAKLQTASGSGDQITAIPTGLTEPDISADITWNSGVAGLAWSVDASNDRAIAFFEGSNIVAGKVKPSDNSFEEFSRAAYTWTAGDTKKMRVRINGTNARIYIDDPSVSGDEVQVMVLAIGTGMGTEKRAGLFSKGTTNLFDNFEVRNKVALAQADAVLGVSDPQTLNPPAVPAGAYLYDSFTYYNGDVIENHNPDLDPTGLGWQIDSGKWKFYGFEVGELKEDGGDKFSFIDTGRDDYQISSEQIWDGGRTGITFGGLAPSNRNVFLYFVQSNGNVVLGKKIGGAFFTLGSKKVQWKSGARKTISVVVQGTELEAYVGKRRMFTVTDADLVGATWAGIFRNAFHEDRFDNFLLKLPEGAPTPTPTPPPTPIVKDLFTESDATNLVGHTLDIAPSSNTWAKSTSRGDWETLSNKAIETGEFDFGIFDRRIVIDAETANHTVSADIVRNGPQWTTSFSRNMFPRMGVVTRSTSNDSQYVMWYFDGVSDVVARSHTAELGRTSFTWTVGDSHNLAITANGDTLSFKIDGETKFSVTHSTGNTNTHVGLYSAEIEEGKANTYDDFRLMPIP